MSVPYNAAARAISGSLPGNMAPQWKSTIRAAVRQDVRTEVRLGNIPRTALHSDIRRLLRRNGITDVARVFLNYNHFHRVGSAILRFNRHESVSPAVDVLRGATLTSFKLNANPTSLAERRLNTRARGVDGREEAASRGIVDGMGPDAGVTERGSSVVVSGIPRKWYPEDVRRELCEGFDLAEAGEAAVVNVTSRPGLWRETRLQRQRHLIRFANTDEAHRFVRARHLTYINDMPVHASIVY